MGGHLILEWLYIDNESKGKTMEKKSPTLAGVAQLVGNYPAH